MLPHTVCWLIVWCGTLISEACGCVVQLVMNSTNEAEIAQCTVTIQDSQELVVDAQLLAFAVMDVPSGQVWSSKPQALALLTQYCVTSNINHLISYSVSLYFQCPDIQLWYSYYQCLAQSHACAFIFWTHGAWAAQNWIIMDKKAKRFCTGCVSRGLQLSKNLVQLHCASTHSLPRGAASQQHWC